MSAETDQQDITLRDWLAEQPWSLALSSGFFGFFAHTGMLSVLEEEGLRPQRVAGASAGALAGGLWAAGVSTETMIDRLGSLEREEFWDPFPGFGLLRGRKFRELLSAMLPVVEFGDFPIPFAVSVYDLFGRDTKVVNDGPVIPAIHASCALPFLFQPVRLGWRPHLDGGIKDRPGLLGIPEGERTLYHHLASRSPWRGKQGAQTLIPERHNLRTLVINNLPRVSPFRLDVGLIAYRQARKATERALDRPLRGNIIRI